MNNLKTLLFFLLTLSAITIIGCGESDPCEDVTCPVGFLCDEGSCLEDPNFDPCDNVTCEAGFICLDGVCIPEQTPCGGVCPEGFTCENNECVPTEAETVVVSGAITSDITWTADKYYELANKVVVDNGATLTIEPGTIIKGREGTGSLATALIIARGSKIQACGTSDKPIIFTSVLDNIKIGENTGSNLTEVNNELWGGLIVLGNAPISAKDGDTETQIEGIPADETYGLYGGNDAMDNSGSMCYISIRHGGALIGADNEINGLTLGGVGNGTTINNIEVVANLDDGIEFFGGTVDVQNAIVTYQGDDAIDIDMNYSGTVTNVMIIHGGADTDEAFEIDGPENATYTDGKFTIINGTAIALDTDKTSAADLKSKAQGTLDNVTWTGYKVGKFASIRASFDTDNGCTSKSDAYTNVVSADLIIKNSEIISSVAGATDVTAVYVDAKASNAAAQQACLTNVASEYEGVVDVMVTNNNNAVNTSITGGADKSVFTWTWTSAKGFLDN